MTNDSNLIRLNKHLALLLGVSRREADDMIAKGTVLVNGKPVILGARIEPGDSISVNGELINNNADHQYVIFNKPIGYVCSRRAQGDNPTIYDLLPADMASLKPVGRLDKNSSGLLILTNDGDFAHQMTHPKFSKVKVYQVSLDTPLQPLHQQMIADYGVEIGDGTSKLGLERTDDERKNWIVTMSEGRNRQIRRTFIALGYEVTELHRTNFGSYSLGDIKSGEYKTINIA